MGSIPVRVTKQKCTDTVGAFLLGDPYQTSTQRVAVDERVHERRKHAHGFAYPCERSEGIHEQKSTDTVGAFLRLVTFTACPTYTTVHQTNDMNPDKCNKMSIKEP